MLSEQVGMEYPLTIFRRRVKQLRAELYFDIKDNTTMNRVRTKVFELFDIDVN